MLNGIIYAMIYLGSALMVYNVVSYVRYAWRMKDMKNWGREKSLLFIPIVLLVMFLIGYLAVGIFGKPDLIISGILFGGSIFVFVIFHLVQRITDRIQANERLEARLMAAEESNRVKTSFLSSVSHEMRTPMNAIIGLDTLALKNPDLPPQTRAQIERIGISARHLLGLIDDVLDMSLVEAGGMALREAPFTLGESLETVNTIIKSQCDVKGLTYEYRLEGIPDSRYNGDDMKLRQVLLSLLENAVKFTPAPGTVRFMVEVLPPEGERRPLRFTVADTGIGIDEAFIPRLFEAFTQEDASTTNRYGGSGLGLAISKSIVDMMGGTIDVTSTKGAGSTFTVSVALGAAQPAPPPSEVHAEEPATVDNAALHGTRILIAEDTDINAEILIDLLDLEEAASDRAENGQIAVDLFAASEPGYYDAILMDLRMPVMDGLDATRAIRAIDRPDAKTIPIVALTANALEEDKRRALEAGMDVHLAKPADAEVLYATLDRLIARNRANRK